MMAVLDCVLVLLFLFYNVNCQLNGTGTVSWQQFDSITFTPSPTMVYTLFHLPQKFNWTGLIGLFPSNSSQENKETIIFTYGINKNNPPALFYTTGTNNQVITNANDATYGKQMSAIGGDGSDDWYFLFASYSYSINSLPQTIGFYMVEMPTIQENDISDPISMSNNQQFLYKVQAAGEPFSSGDVISISYNHECKLWQSVGVGSIPSIDPSQAQYHNTSQTYMYLDGNSTFLYFVIALLDDCSSLTVNISRVQRVIEFQYGDTFYINSTAFFRSSSQLIGVDVASMFGGQYYISSGDFFLDNKLTEEEQTFSPDLSEQTWYIYAESINSRNISFSFSNPAPTATSFDVEIEEDRSIGCDTNTNQYYTFPSSCYRVCLNAGYSSAVVMNAGLPAQPGNSSSMTNNCVYKPLPLVKNGSPNITDYSIDNITISIRFPFSNSFATSATYQFEGVCNITTIQFGQTINFGDSQFTNQTDILFYVAPMNTLQGGLIYMNTSSDYGSFTVAPDDWSKAWSINVPFWGQTVVYTYNSPLYQELHGWYIVATPTQPQDFYMQVISVDEHYIVIDNTVPTNSTTIEVDFSSLDGGNAILALIHVYIPIGAVAIKLNFSRELPHVVGLAGSIPDVNLGNAPVIVTRGSDLILVDQTNVTTFVLSGVAHTIGVVSQHFYVLLYGDSNDPISVTTSLINMVDITTANSSGQTNVTWQSTSVVVLEIQTSTEPQLFRFNFPEKIVSTNLTLVNYVGPPNHSNENGNLTDMVVFGAGGLQTVVDNRADSDYNGMTLSPSSNYYYRQGNNNTNDFYFLVYPNSPSIQLIVTQHKVQHLCNPVLLCNGHGYCGDREQEGCNCLEGPGFSYNQEYCSEKETHFIGLWLALCCILFYVLVKIVMYYTLRQKIRNSFESEEDERLSLISNFGSESLASYCIRTEITLVDVNFQVENKKAQNQDNSKLYLLRDVNLRVSPGQLTAIIGPSGAGKSTIIKLLSGNLRPSSGSIFINKEKFSTFGNLRSLIGYVPQDDVMSPVLTVREVIMHSALMRLPRSMQLQEKERIVDFVINALGLEKLAHTQVGDIGGQSSLSGGQRKRVSIGIELVMCPSILLLDEPSSGLDSQTALSLIRLLKTHIAPLGVNVIAVLHQPRYEILTACDNIGILNQGKFVYFGSPRIDDLCAAYSSFNNDMLSRGANIADLLIDHIADSVWPGFVHDANILQLHNNITEGTIDDIESTLRANYNNINTAHAHKSLKRQLPLFHSQFYLLLKRALTQVFRDGRSIIVLNILVIVAAILIGLLYRNSRFIGPPAAENILQCPASFQFLCAQNQEDSYLVQALLISLSLGLVAGSSSLTIFGGSEKLVFARERGTGQSNVAYYLAKTVAGILNQLLAPLLYVSIFHLLTQPDVVFWKLLIICWCIYDVCMNIAIVTTVSFADSRALVVSVVIICIFNMISGFNPSLIQLKHNFGTFLGTAIPGVSYSRWMLEASYLLVLDTYNNIYNIDISLSTWDYHLGDFWFSIGIAAAMGVFLRIVSLVIILWKSRVK